MSDSQQDDLKKRLGLPTGGAPQPGGDASRGVPPPVVGGVSPLPPPVFKTGSAIPPPALGKRQVDVAPPPFLVRRKQKRIKKIIEEVYEDVGPVIDRRAIERRKKLIIVCAIVAVPLIVMFFYVGMQRQTWALMDRSRVDASKVLKKLSAAGPVIEQVGARTGAALGKARSYELDTGFLEFTRDMIEQRPINNSDLDMLNYAAFDPETVDGCFQLLRTTDMLWGELAAHRTITRTDIDALQSYRDLGIPPTQTRYGVLLTALDQYTLGANVGVVSHPSKNDMGEDTLDIQLRPGRKAHPIKAYSRGPFGKKINDWVIPVDPAQSAEGAPLAKADDSHWVGYIKRLEKLNSLVLKAQALHGELTQKLKAISG